MLINNQQNRRKGMILLVIIAFLALFTIMGLTYLLYADAQLRFSIDEIKRLDKRNYRSFDLSTDYLFNFFLERFIYDQPDREADPYATATAGINYEPQSVYSALRGHSLARNMYGYNERVGTYASQPAILTGVNDRAFSGSGKLANKQITIPGTSVTGSEHLFVNSTYFKSFGQSQIIDPERGARSSLTIPANYSSSWNAPYTYPDYNNIYLAWLRSDGALNPYGSMVMKASFSTESTFGKMDASSLPSGSTPNPNWLNDKGRYMSIRPRPVDNLIPADYIAAAGNQTQLNQIINQRILEGNLIPYPGADGMDVKNLESYPGGNDSIWIDVGSPVFYNIDGRKIKILIAPLIVELDSRINLNVVGNNMVAGNHGSNQGWGPWEINAQKINGAINPTAKFLSNANSFPISELAKVDFNGGRDIAADMTGLPVVGSAVFPGQNKAGTSVNSFQSFPTYPSGNFGNLARVPDPIYELRNHTSTWNPFSIGSMFYSTDDLQYLLRWTGKGSSTSGIASSTPALKTRNLVTSRSIDFSKPAFVPYYADSSTNNYQLALNTYYPKSPNPEKYLSTNALPANQNLSDFDLTVPRSMASLLTKLDLSRTLTAYPNVSTTFTGAMGGGGRYLNNTGYTTAVSDRQKFALDIFTALLKLTGAKDMSLSTIPLQGVGALDPDYETNRYLAQLAANMVDYIDNDDVMTKFVWKYNPALSVNNVGGTTYYPSKFEPTYWEDISGNILMGGGVPVPRDATLDERVYGVELNKVVLNEVYAEIINDPTDTFPEKPANSNKFPATSSKPFQVHFWVELVNPLPAATAVGSLVNHAILEQDPRAAAGDSSVYQLEIRDQSAVDDIFKPDNPLGVTRPDMAGKDRSKGLVSNFQPAVAGGAVVNLLSPAAGNYLGTENAANGFIVLGSNTAFPGGAAAADMPKPYSDINNIANIKKNELTYTIAIEKPAGTPDPDYDKATFTTTLQNKNKPSIVLRRLANPYMPPQIDATQPDYNPYVTVDVMNDIKINDAATNATDDKKAAPPTVENRSSVVRRQPYQESGKNDVAGIFDVSTNMVKPLVQQPQHTFLRHNGTLSEAPGGINVPDSLLQLPFTPISHLDRQLVNPIELLEVAGCKPAEVTRRFINENDTAKMTASIFKTQNNNNFYGHKIPWMDDQNRLLRFLELASPQIRFAGTSIGGKEFGKVNINGVWDKETFRALADASNNINGFTEAEVDAVFQQILDSRSPIKDTTATPNNMPGPNDKPFWGFGVGGTTGADDLSSGARGVGNSFLRPVAPNAATGVFDLPINDTTMPTPIKRTSLQQKELLSKISNSVTTRSNVFAVWLTTGFFEVTDDSTQPPKLGAEIGIADGTNIRHRMFAILDRTNMKSFETYLRGTGLSDISSGTSTLLPLTNVTISTSPVTIVACPTIMAGMTVTGWETSWTNASGLMLNGQPWSIRENMMLTFDPDSPGEETVALIKNTTTGKLEVKFKKTHGANCVIINRGNPGPWPFYNRGVDPVVITSSVIE